ncbi:MAG: MarR family transcriptional regulator [Alphaproteobacteria bacterium]|nr:MarR family transcriptional regulator [Alphaproteobacteria bacterium]MCL2889728.1 MarR family transcriptional regulator [Alphaproteobacteria bacterium]
MQHKEFVGLMESNFLMLDWLDRRLKSAPGDLGHSRTQIRLLARLHLHGRTLLKDIARSSEIPTSNLCILLKNLESDGLVLRQVDAEDRRNTWYSLTRAGEKVACEALESLRCRIAALFEPLGQKDEARLTSALRTMNEILHKIKTTHNKE